MIFTESIKLFSQVTLDIDRFFGSGIDLRLLILKRKPSMLCTCMNLNRSKNCVCRKLKCVYKEDESLMAGYLSENINCDVIPTAHSR